MTHQFPPEPAFTGIHKPSRAEVNLVAAEIHGAIPSELQGAYYQVSPDPTYPPFHKNFAPIVDGNGMVVMFRFRDGQVDFRSRYVRTERFNLEREANCALFGEYRNPFTDHPSVKGKDRGTANTTMREHAGILWALKEDSLGVQVEEFTLETVGTNNFGGRVTSKTMTAHPEFDPGTGEMIFYGSAAKGETTPDIAFYIADKTGQIVKEEWLVAPYASMVHQSAVTKNWVVFPVMPTASSMERIKAGGPIYDWEPERGAFLGLMPRTGTAADVRWIQIDPLWFFHIMNAFEGPDGRIHMDVGQSLVQPMPWFHADPARTWNPRAATPYLTRWTLDPRTGEFSRTQLTNVVGEMPRIDDRFGLSEYRHGYMSATDPARPPRGMPGGGTTDSIAHIDHKTGDMEFAYAGDDAAFEEPQFVPRSADAPEGDGFVIAIRHNWATLGTDLTVHDTADLSAGPVAVVELPFRLRPGTHGTWVADKA